MDFNSIVMKGFLFFMFLFTCAFFVQRFLWRRRRRLGKRRLGFYPSVGSMGNALHQLQILAQPQVKYVLEEKLEEEAEEDDVAGPEDPMAHLHRQVARIRRGQKTGRLTVRLRK
jgi:hypothetical protein